MKNKNRSKTFLGGILSAALMAGTLFGATASADSTVAAPVPPPFVNPLSGADSLLTTFFSKSKISGGIRKNADGTLAINPDTGDAPFDFSGQIYYPVTTSTDGSLVGTYGPIGTVSGTVIFPKAFSDLAFGFVGYLNGGPMPTIPPVIKWTMAKIKIVDAGTTYVPLGDANVNNDPMGLAGRAFTGLGPVEVGTLLNGADGMSMSVRMGGCFAVQAIDGPNAGKIGTYCLNSTFTFDLSKINTADPMHSSIPGTGSSNCITVLQTPMQMQ